MRDEEKRKELYKLEICFLYLDPPYMDSFNGGYNCYNKNYNEDLPVKDNTAMYIFLLEYLKVCKCIYSFKNI